MEIRPPQAWRKEVIKVRIGICKEGNQTILGKEGNQTILGKEGNQAILGKEGNQTIPGPRHGVRKLLGEDRNM